MIVWAVYCLLTVFLSLLLSDMDWLSWNERCPGNIMFAWLGFTHELPILLLLLLCNPFYWFWCKCSRLHIHASIEQHHSKMIKPNLSNIFGGLVWQIETWPSSHVGRLMLEQFIQFWLTLKFNHLKTLPFNRHNLNYFQFNCFRCHNLEIFIRIRWSILFLPLICFFLTSVKLINNTYLKSLDSTKYLFKSSVTIVENGDYYLFIREKEKERKKIEQKLTEPK